jgi:formylglycine-generating enzyme required for sulfatase activity/tRNA A-37 threonylcarbamoyl transferase component Bud32
MADPPLPFSGPDEPLGQLLADVIRRRSEGERLSDAELIARHPELMPTLAEWLGKLRLLARAKARADDAARIDAGFEDSFAPRVVVEGYDVQREISRGGQSIVYLARRSGSQEQVAIKTLLDGTLADDAARARFEREARILASLDSPGIVKVLHSGVSRTGLHYLVLPYIEGESLDAHFAPPSGSDPQTWRRAQLRLFVAILRAVGAAHTQGVIHRDLKPSNIRIDRGGDPHVLDFGLAYRGHIESLATTRSITATGQFIGSFPWASPEQAGSGEPVTARSDVYSLGVLLYQSLSAGQFPYEVAGPLRELLNNIIAARPAPPPKQLDPRLGSIVLKALSKAPTARYADANEFADDMERFLAGQPIRAARGHSRRKRIVGVACIAAMLAIVPIVTIATRHGDRPGAASQPTVNGRPRVDMAPNCSFIWIPPGEFTMGSPDNERGRLPDELQHKVTIPRGFYMLQGEVTQEMYTSVVGSNPARFNGYLNPVEQVSWDDAQEFCRRLSQRDGRTFRLPTEAEWEYACRAGTTTAWSFGDDQDLLPRYANFYDRSSPETRPGRSAASDGWPYTAPVSRYLANRFGLVDMHGNVWEWCQDDYRPYSINPATAPAATQHTMKVARGGSWYDSIYSLRSAHRNPLEPSFKNDNLGFRVVMEDPASPRRKNR